jgi:3-isopropylmalate dehydrogenase/3-isopropylmalate/(R)-2-methylmalate dehydratase small subunit
MEIRGKVWKYGDNIDTDVIIPGRYCHIVDPAELGKHALADLDPGFVGKMTRGDLIVAGTNFGCGSSREMAPIAIKAAGVSAVVAASFARIFFRNAINIGLPIFQSAEAARATENGDELAIDPESGVIQNLTRGEQYQAAAFPDFIQDIVRLGGLKPYVEKRLRERRAQGS